MSKLCDLDFQIAIWDGLSFTSINIPGAEIYWAVPRMWIKRWVKGYAMDNDIQTLAYYKRKEYCIDRALIGAAQTNNMHLINLLKEMGINNTHFLIKGFVKGGHISKAMNLIS